MHDLSIKFNKSVDDLNSTLKKIEDQPKKLDTSCVKTIAVASYLSGISDFLEVAHRHGLTEAHRQLLTLRQDIEIGGETLPPKQQEPCLTRFDSTK